MVYRIEWYWHPSMNFTLGYEGLMGIDAENNNMCLLDIRLTLQVVIVNT